MRHSWRPVLFTSLLPLLGCLGSISGIEPGEESPGAGEGAQAGDPVPPAGGAPARPTVMGGAEPSAPPEAAMPGRCSPASKPASPAVLRRLTAAQWAASVRALLGTRPADITNPFDEGTGGGARFSTFSSSGAIPPEVARALLDAAEKVADRLAPVLAARHTCLRTTPATRSCLEMALSAVGASAFRRPLTADELAFYVGIVGAEQPKAGADMALRVALAAMLASPRFVYLWQLGSGPPDGSGRLRLSPHDLAAALSYAITDGPPDAALAAAATRGELSTPQQVRAQVERLFAAAGDLPSVGRFFSEYFGYGKAVLPFKDPAEFPFHRPAELVDDTDRFVRHAVAGKKDVIATLLAGTTGFVRAATARTYGLTTSAQTPTLVTFPRGQRAGILTQPSWLVAHSINDANLPVQRGRDVSESLLCRTVPDLPLTEVPAVPDRPDSTFRERLQEHSRNPQCVGCHALMDPLGLAFEHYDHVGRYRTKEGTRPIDARGELTGAGPADGPFQDAVELAERLARSPVVEACVIRHAMRYWLGRNEGEADGCTFEAARLAYARSGGDVTRAFAEILSSDSFVYRTQRPEQ